MHLVWLEMSYADKLVIANIITVPGFNGSAPMSLVHLGRPIILADDEGVNTLLVAFVPRDSPFSLVYNLGGDGSALVSRHTFGREAPDQEL